MRFTDKTLLVTGGSGYLGRHLCAKAIKKFVVYTTYGSRPGRIRAGDPLPLDITNRWDVLELVADLAPQAIIHTAALNPGQGDDRAMMRINAEGSLYVAEAAQEVGARLVHLSTDVVHSGRIAPYADDARPFPLHAYGRSKAAAEVAVAEIDPRAAIVRTSLIYGLQEMDRGTAGFAERLKKGQPLVLFKDVIRQPIWVDTLCEALLKLIDIDFGGLLNVAGSQALTREEFGRKLLTWWNVDGRGLLQAGWAADISARVPLDLRMTIDKAEQLLQMTFPGVDEILARHQG